MSLMTVRAQAIRTTRTPRSVPVVPGAIVEYVIRIYPFANTFVAGNKLVVELMCNEPLADEHNSLLPPDAYHLPVGLPVTHTIYRDALHQSRCFCLSPGRRRHRNAIHIGVSRYSVTTHSKQ
jgi:hypothetical protein